MTKKTFFQQIELLYTQQELREYPPVEIREEDGSYTEYSYLIKRIARPVTSDLLEKENQEKIAHADTVVDEALIETIKAAELAAANTVVDTTVIDTVSASE